MCPDKTEHWLDARRWGEWAIDDFSPNRPEIPFSTAFKLMQNLNTFHSPPDDTSMHATTVIFPWTRKSAPLWLTGVTYSLASNYRIASSLLHSKPSNNHVCKSQSPCNSVQTLLDSPFMTSLASDGPGVLGAAYAWHNDIFQISTRTNVSPL